MEKSGKKEKCRAFGQFSRNSSLPDRWLDYSNVGDRIPGTRFVCMKVPLKAALCRPLIKEQWFTPAHVVSELTNRGVSLGLLIDLTNTYRYYNPKDMEALGVLHAKIMVKGHEIPGREEVNRFCNVVDQFETEQTTGDKQVDLAIGVHCTHGVNRTGYLVCRYLIDRKGWTIENAISAFNLARGHNIERENYLNALRNVVETPIMPRVEFPPPASHVVQRDDFPSTSWRNSDRPNWQWNGSNYYVHEHYTTVPPQLHNNCPDFNRYPQREYYEYDRYASHPPTPHEWRNGSHHWRKDTGRYLPYRR